MQQDAFLSKKFIIRQFNRLYDHFDTAPPDIKLENYWFYTISNVAYTLAWMVHALWMVVFYLIGQYTMMWIQLAGISFYAVTIIFNRKGHHFAGLFLGGAEVIGHAVIATRLLGWGAGFQYYLPVIAVFPFLKHKGSWVLKASIVASMLLSYLYLDIYVKGLPPIFNLGNTIMNRFYYSNFIASFLIMSMWGLLLTAAYQRTVNLLINKEQELYNAEKDREQADMQRQLEVKERDNEIYRLRNVELKASHDEIVLQNHVIEEEKKKYETLLLNILPEATASELLREGYTKSRRYDSVTVMFTDFVGFTGIAERMKAEELVKRIDDYFSAFDDIIQGYGIEKIKTIGDSYMCVGGLPLINETNPVDVLRAAMDIMKFIESEKSGHSFNVRVGLHTGPLVAGVVGKHKFQYDIWGDTVNVAARMEQNSEPGRINISGATFEQVKSHFDCVYRGKINAKNKGEMDMYFVNDKIR